MERNKTKLAKSGFGVAAISYDSTAVLKNFAERKNITVPLLSDDGSETIRAFGLINEEIPKNTPFYGVPVPVTLIVDPKGKVLSRHYEENYRQRFTTGNVLSKAGITLEEGVTPVSAKHATLQLSSSDTTVRGGERILLRVRVDLPKRVHVYAPGVTGYIPVEWKLDNTPAADPLPVTFPRSKVLRLKAIRESVPVYQNSFVLEREVVISQKNPAGDLLLVGSFRYQACDDRICYVPETVPLQWKLTFELHDSTRVPPELRHKVN